MESTHALKQALIFLLFFGHVNSKPKLSRVVITVQNLHISKVKVCYFYFTLGKKTIFFLDSKQHETRTHFMMGFLFYIENLKGLRSAV